LAYRISSEEMNQRNPSPRANGLVIKLLGDLFRGVSFVFGTTAPSPEEDQRSFVFMWLGIIVFLAVFGLAFFYVLWRMSVP
jgi:nucleoside permease NupC